MSEPSSRDWRLYVQDMITCATKAQGYIEELTLATFVESSLHYDATIRNLELIGEAATHIPTAIRDQFPQIPWRQMIAMRNRLIHGYLGIDDDVIWSVLHDDLPTLIQQLQEILATQDTE